MAWHAEAVDMRAFHHCVSVLPSGRARLSLQCSWDQYFRTQSLGTLSYKFGVAEANTKRRCHFGVANIGDKSVIAERVLQRQVVGTNRNGLVA